jgi:hypothetical protein
MSRQLRSEAVRAGVYGDPAGYRGLREAIARHIGVARGVEASADDVTVVSGTQQALDVVARSLLTRHTHSWPRFSMRSLPCRRASRDNGPSIQSAPDMLGLDELVLGLMRSPGFESTMSSSWLTDSRPPPVYAWAARNPRVPQEADADAVLTESRVAHEIREILGFGMMA